MDADLSELLRQMYSHRNRTHVSWFGILSEYRFRDGGIGVLTRIPPRFSQSEIQEIVVFLVQGLCQSTIELLEV